jgi:hypothetical protein
MAKASCGWTIGAKLVVEHDVAAEHHWQQLPKPADYPSGWRHP